MCSVSNQLTACACPWKIICVLNEHVGLSLTYHMYERRTKRNLCVPRSSRKTDRVILAVCAMRTDTFRRKRTSSLTSNYPPRSSPNFEIGHCCCERSVYTNARSPHSENVLTCFTIWNDEICLIRWQAPCWGGKHYSYSLRCLRFYEMF